MQTDWWYSSKKMTVLVIEENGVIVRTAPVVGKFAGQPVANLQSWMTKQGNFRIECLRRERSNMVPPKPAKASPKPAKATPKPGPKAPTAAPVDSVFAAMKKQSALAKHMAKAKQVVATREFDGPDGDYTVYLSRVSHYTKEGSLGIVFEFRVMDEGDVQDQKLMIFFIFKQTDRETVQEIQNRFFETLQLMGIDTDIDDKQLEVELATLVTNKVPLTVRVKTSKSTGGKFPTVIGLASAALEVADTEYVEEAVEEAVEETEAVDNTEEAVDEWEEEVPAEEAVDPPSAWVGYGMFYKGTEVEVVAADDTTMKCTIKAGNKKLIVPFSVLVPPPSE